MKLELQHFLESNLLEKYLIGETTDLETAKVEYYILKYPKVKKAYETLQTNLELKAKFDAVEPKQNKLNSILAQIKQIEPRKPNTPWYAIAASVAALIFALSSTYLYINNDLLKTENNIIAEEIFDLRKDIESNNAKLNTISYQLSKLNNPDAKKYVISGNELAEELKTVAYINPIEKTALIDVIRLPKISEDQYYKISAELQNRKISLGILDDNSKNLKPLPYLEDAIALSITLETVGDSLNNNSVEVAQLALK